MISTAKILRAFLRIKILWAVLLYSTVISGSNWTVINSPEATPARINLLTSDITTSTISFTIDGFILNDAMSQRGNASYVRLENSTPLLLSGCPDLVKLTSSVIIPDKDEMAVSILSSHYTDYINIDIIPSKGDLSRNLNPSGVQFEYSDVYTTDAFFPGNLAEISDPFIMRDFRGQTVIVYPFQYNPVTKILRVYDEITVQITSTGREGKNPLLRTSALTAIQPEFLALYNHHFLNSGNATDKRYEFVSENGMMLIISYGPFMQTMAPFIEWKKTIGIPTEMVDVATIGDANAIKTYVENYYNNNGLTYLLIVGDAQQVPPYMSESGASDISYAFVAGQDHYPDLFVGRFSAENSDQLRVQVQKTINYERYPYSSGEWLKNSVGIASSLGPGDDNERDYQHVRNMQNDLINFTYTSNFELFDGSQGNNDQNGNPTWEMVADRINNGAGLLLYTGISSTSNWSTSNFNNDHINTLNNNGKYPFIISVGCLAGNFVNGTCMAEIWLRASKNGNPTGAVAAFMSTSTQSWYPPMAAQDEMIDILTSNVPANMKFTFGGLTASGCMAMNDKYYQAGYKATDTWVVFGDPSLQIRTDNPSVMDVQHPAAIAFDCEQITIIANVNNGLATFTSQGEIIGSGYISDGSATILFNKTIQSDSITIAVTSFNHIPFISRIPVIKYPTVAVNPFPENHSKMVSPYTKLNWEKGFGARPAYYIVYFGTDNPPSNLINGQIVSDTIITLNNPLSYEQVYYWKVDAVNANGLAEGNIWEFTVNSVPDETFENSGLIRELWDFAGTSGWEIDETYAQSGRFSAHSGIVTDNEYSSILYDYNALDDDYVGFWAKVSCELNKDKLQLLVDGIIIAEYSGEIEWSEYTYPVPQGMHTLEWKYIKDEEGTSGMDGAWIDDLYLPDNDSISAFAGKDATICADRNYELSGYANNYTSLLWTTYGNGYFIDDKALSTLYIPGVDDVKQGYVLLKLEAINAYAETIVSDEMVLDFMALPAINSIPDTILDVNQNIVLDAYGEDIANYLWLPYEQTASSLFVDSTGIGVGLQKIKLYVTGNNGCVNEKTINITFEQNRDNSGISLNVYPNPSPGVVFYEMSSDRNENFRYQVLDLNGKLVLQSDKVESKKNYSGMLDLSFLPEGMYFFKADGEQTSTVQRIILQ